MDSVLKAIISLQPMHSVAGFIVGTLIGLTGVGGGSLMTPLLILLFGLHPSTAVGTDLLFAATTKSAGTLVHGINQTIDWRVVGRLAIGSAPATVMSMACLSYIDITSSIAKEIITAVLSVALLVTAVLLTSRRWIIKRYASQVGNLTSSCTAILTIAVGAVLGVLVSISSVGAGAIGMTALVLLYPQTSDSTSRRLRYRPCCSAHFRSWDVALGTRLRGLARFRIANFRLNTGNFDW